MSKFEKLLFIILMGSLWGALELFGGDQLRAWGVPNKSALLFGLGLIILYASKRVVNFAGSPVIMALIAGLFKTVSSNFYPCQFAAIVINGIIFDGAYGFYKNQLNSSPIYRSMAAPVITILSFAVFAFFATYVLQQVNWVERGLKGIGEYIYTDGLMASLISILTINLGYYLGTALRSYFESRKADLPFAFFRVISISVVAVIWIAGQIY